ncbi:hypothetical protein O181_048133 [Austropuccinia psidii MF-1]|uniref:Uncharacterized protein n=1 Tax=Austropuccinia psidii MF-1 TaxID=1389203 RepID=A0A9Q3HK69_9BASI|nr:hypothetical protein [Austropuccinia psidii MF-1]
MPLETCAALLADDTKTQASENICNILRTMQEEINSLRTSHASELADLRALLAPNTSPSSYPDFKSPFPAYKKFMQSPYKDASRVPTLQLMGENYDDWLLHMEKVLSFTFETPQPVEAEHSMLSALTSRISWLVFNFIDSTMPAEFSLTLGLHPLSVTVFYFFGAIRSSFSPGSCFEKMSVVLSWMDLVSNTMTDPPMPIYKLILHWSHIFATILRLKIQLKKLEGFFLQATAAPPSHLNMETSDQLVSSMILSNGGGSPTAVFVGQVLSNTVGWVDLYRQEEIPFVDQLLEATKEKSCD